MVVTPILDLPDSPKLAKITDGITERENENDQKASQQICNHRRAYRVIELYSGRWNHQAGSISFGGRHGRNVAGSGGDDATGGGIGAKVWDFLLRAVPEPAASALQHKQCACVESWRRRIFIERFGRKLFAAANGLIHDGRKHDSLGCADTRRWRQWRWRNKCLHAQRVELHVARLRDKFVDCAIRDFVRELGGGRIKFIG